MSNPRDLDVDIASWDGVQFRVRKSLLSEASPVFNDLFSVSQPNPGLDAPTDVVKLSEPSKTIRLLFLSLPESPPSHLVDSLSDLADLLQAADKYDMKTILDHAISFLDKPKFLFHEPLRVYALASRYGAHHTAQLAARRTIQYPLLHAEYISDLEIVDGWTIYRVLRYHKQCMTAALELATDHTWIRDGYVFFDCPGASYGEDDDEDEAKKALTTTIRTHPSRKHKNGYLKEVSVHSWWTKFMDSTKVALSESICSETIRDRERVIEALSSASQCSRCGRRVRSDFSKFLDMFVYEVEARVKQVSCILWFIKCRSLDLYFWIL